MHQLIASLFLGLSSIGHSVSIHQSCQYRRYSDISKEPEEDKRNNSVIVKQNLYYLPSNENTMCTRM